MRGLLFWPSMTSTLKGAFRAKIAFPADFLNSINAITGLKNTSLDF